MSRILVGFLGLLVPPLLGAWADDEVTVKPPAKSAKRQAIEPRCPYHVTKTAPRPKTGPVGPAPTSMPEFFMRMGQNFATNPAGGFQSMINELSSMEGPALEGVRVSPAEEREAGRRAREEYLRQAAARGYPESRDDQGLARLEDLVERYAALMKHRDRYPKIEVTLIDAPVADGQSFPGGYLVFTSALLKAPSEDSIAGVVAHELAHLDLGHLYQYAKRGKLAETTYANPPGGGTTFDQFFTRQMALFGLLMNPYRPEHELEADCLAVTWMHRQGHDPTELAAFFERLHKRLGDRPNDPNFGFAFGRSHPYSLDRKRHVERRHAQLRRAN